MSCLSLAFSLSFFLKTRTLKRLSRNPVTRAFDKTFYVVDTYPEHRRTMNNVAWLEVLALVVPFVLSILFLMFSHVGPVITSSIILFLCLSLMMIESALEIYQYANKFEEAFVSGTALGEGDLVALSFVKQTMPKLSLYYLLLAIIFLASFAAAPHITSAASLVLSQFADMAVSVTMNVSLILMGVYVGMLGLVLAVVIALDIGRTIKSRIFDLPRSIPFSAIEEQFVRAKMGMGRERPPFELSHRPILEDPDVEERKRRGLCEKRGLDEKQ